MYNIWAHGPLGEHDLIPYSSTELSGPSFVTPSFRDGFRALATCNAKPSSQWHLRLRVRVESVCKKFSALDLTAIISMVSNGTCLRGVKIERTGLQR